MCYDSGNRCEYLLGIPSQDAVTLGIAELMQQLEGPNALQHTDLMLRYFHSIDLSISLIWFFHII